MFQISAMEQRDERLWRIAQKRAEFRKSLYSYIIINTLLWFIWWFTGGYTGRGLDDSGPPWPVWVMLGWGIWLCISYYKAYHGDKSNMAEREYERMKRKAGR